MKKIFLAEDHPIVADAVSLIITSMFNDVKLQVAASCNEMMNGLKSGSYDLAILDLQLSDALSMHLIPEIIKLYPSLPILIFSANPEELYAQKLYRDGVKGFLSKYADRSEIEYAITRILSGNIYMSDNFKHFLLDKNSGSKSPLFGTLSQRETEVAMLLLQGKRTSEIGQELNLRASTVATYKMKIFTKLKISSVVGLEQIARNLNIIH